MPVPQERYTESGRRAQKERTRQALLVAARRLMADGSVPTVEEAAAAAGISRTTAYRYFAGRDDLVLAAHPEVGQTSLLPDDAPADAPSRVGLVLDTHLRTLLEWEPQLRAALRLSLDPATTTDQLPLRQGRAIGWLEQALAPLRESHPQIDVRRLAIALRAAAGIEPLVWLTDVAGLDRADAAALMRRTALAVLRAELSGPGDGRISLDNFQ